MLGYFLAMILMTSVIDKPTSLAGESAKTQESQLSVSCCNGTGRSDDPSAIHQKEGSK